MSNGGTLKVELEGRGPLTLRQSDYKASGGEGSVYQAHGTAVKIYTDPAKMQRDGMAQKVRLLKTLAHPAIMAPQGVVKDSSGKAIGLYMPFAEGVPLAQIFTGTFRQREGLDDEHAKKIVGSMRDITRFAHDRSAVMVDPNELSWVVDIADKKNPRPKIFDVDSWAIGKWGASAIMPSIRDWHTKGFTALSDWFSWGVVTFQVFTGIHPYHGTLAPYKRGDFEARMKANASVFHQGVGLNRAVRDFRSIPGPLRDWYEATFEQGSRSIPPSPFDKGVSAIAPAARVYRSTNATGALVFEKLFDGSRDGAVHVFGCGVIRLSSGSLYDLATKRIVGKLDSTHGEVVRVPQGWLIADLVAGAPQFTYVDDRTLEREMLAVQIAGREFLRVGERLFVVGEEELSELSFMHVGRPLLSVVRRTQILSPKATKWFEGCGVEEALGATFMVLPFGEESCVTVRVRELDGLVPVSGKAGNRFASLIAQNRSGEYLAVELTFTQDYSAFAAKMEKADGPELNIALLPKGVTATIPDDGELEIFVPPNGNAVKVRDKQLATDMLLCNWADTVVYIQNGDVWKLRMK